MKIREVTQGDTEALIGLYHELLPWENLDFKKSKEILREILNTEQYHIFVLEKENRIISTCTLVVIKNITHAGHPYGILENVVTTEAFRGHGYGEILLRRVIDFAKQSGCHKLMVQTRKKEDYVVQFYKIVVFQMNYVKVSS